MSGELAFKLYQQASDRLEEYIRHAPPASDEHPAPSPGEREQEIERLRHAVELAKQAYVRARADHAEG